MIKYISKPILNVIDKLTEYDDNVIFGGSISLIATGLLNRNVSDIDIITSNAVRNKDYTMIKGFSNPKSAEDEYKAIKGQNDKVLGTRKGIYIDDVKVCVFRHNNNIVPACKFINFCGRDLIISSPKNAILAKLEYIKKGGKSVQKHIDDIEEISKHIDINKLDDYFNDFNLKL